MSGRHRCGYCGAYGHKRPTCPKINRDVESAASLLSSGDESGFETAVSGIVAASRLTPEEVAQDSDVIGVGSLVRIKDGAYSREYNGFEFIVERISDDGTTLYGALPDGVEVPGRTDGAKVQGGYLRSRVVKVARDSAFDAAAVEQVASATAEAVKPRKRKSGKLSQWDVAEATIEEWDRVLLYGPPGTGKTTAANLAGNPGVVSNVTCTEEMAAAELRGHFVPRGGEFVWMDGPGLARYRNGGRLVLNEIDKASADAAVFCFALLDDPGISAITLPTGETVKPHPNYSVVATMNGEPSDLLPALEDRFVAVLIDKPHPAAMESLPEDLRAAAFNSVAGSDEARVSFRTWKAYAELRERVGEEIAGRAVFGPRFKAITDAINLSRVKS